MVPMMIDVDEVYPDDLSMNRVSNEEETFSTISPQYRKGYSNNKFKDCAFKEINQLQTQSYASTLVSGAIEKGSTISDSDQQLTEILLSPSTDAEIQMIDRLIESPELFPTLPSEKQAFVLYWIMFICEFLHRDIEKGTFPSGIIQNFEVNGRNYGEYRTDLQYMLHAVNSEFPGVLQIYLENINSYLEKEYK